MAKKFLVNIDLGGNQLLNALAHPQSGSPTAYGKGQLWFDTINNQLNVYNGTTFVPLTTGGTSVTSLNGYTGGVTLYGTASQVTVTNTGTGSITFSLPSTVSLTTACATNFYGAFNGTATNSTQLNNQNASYYAPIASPNFTTGASVAGNRIITIADKFTAASAAVSSSELASIISDETGTGLLVFNNAPTFTGTVNLGTSVASGSVTTALNSASLGGQPFSYFAPITNPNFTTGASVGGNKITTVADKFTAHTAAVSSSELAGVISDETGTGALVFNNSPSFVTPNIGVATGSVTYATTAGNANTVTNGVYTTDTGTVTSTMILNGTILDIDINAAANIAVSKLSASQVTIGSTAIGLGTTSSSIAGLTTACATNFYGAFNGNATTATTATNLSGGTVNATTGSFSSTLNVTGTSTLGITGTGALTSTTGSFSSNLTASTGTTTLGTTNVGALTATTGSFSSSANISDTTQSTSTSTGALVVGGGAGIGKNLYIGGDLSVSGSVFVSGSAFTVSGSSLSISDPMIYLGTGNPANLNDLGFVGHFNNGTYQHTGFVRDHNDSIWKLFSGITTEPTNVMDFTSPTYDKLAVGGLNIQNGTTTTASITGAGSANFSGLTISGASVATLAYVAGYAPAKYTGTITGTGSLNSFTITHNLGTRNVIVQVYQTSATPDTQYAEIEVDIVRTSTTAVTVNFANNVALNDTYNVIVLG
jgi:hypothetical protein